MSTREAMMNEVTCVCGSCHEKIIDISYAPRKPDVSAVMVKEGERNEMPYGPRTMEALERLNAATLARAKALEKALDEKMFANEKMLASEEAFNIVRRYPSLAPEPPHSSPNSWWDRPAPTTADLAQWVGWAGTLVVAIVYVAEWLTR